MPLTTASLPSSSFNTSALRGFVRQVVIVRVSRHYIGRSGSELAAAFVAIEMHRPIFLRFKRADFVSRSQIRRRAGLCTRPALKPRRIFPHNNGERLKPTRWSKARRAYCASTRSISISRGLATASSRRFGDFVEHDTLRLDVFQTAFGFEGFQKDARKSSPSLSGSVTR